MEIDSGKVLDDELNWLKFGGLTWDKDGTGFYYARFPEPEEGKAFQSTNLNSKVYYHKLGSSQDEDVLIYEDPENPEWGFMPTVTEDGDFLIITVMKGTDDRYQVYYKSLADADSEFVKLIDNFENEYSFMANYGSTFYFKTNVDAPNGKIIAININQPERENWKTIIPEANEALGWSGSR